ncbi:MAG TPA: NADH-quinone oxidoreductase subunit J [Bacteroidota bacterium]|nr:NADH-quinone oxidoreductase subunit J [Bacteroidota bacterium]
MDQLSSLTLFDIVFYFFALITIVSAAIVAFSKNIVHSAFSLMFTFFGVAGLYVMLNADFIAVTQVLVYVGGILVLILFGVMLTTKVIGVEMKTGTLRVLPASILAAVLVGTLCGIFWITDWPVQSAASADVPPTTSVGIGKALMTSYLLPFEVASVVLLVAMLGAAMIARRERKKQS